MICLDLSHAENEPRFSHGMHVFLWHGCDTSLGVFKTLKNRFWFILIDYICFIAHFCSFGGFLIQTLFNAFCNAFERFWLNWAKKFRNIQLRYFPFVTPCHKKGLFRAFSGVCDRSICHRVLELDLISSFFSDEFLAGLNSHFHERKARGRIQRKIWRNFLIKRETPYLIIIGRQKKLEKSWKIVLFFQLFSFFYLHITKLVIY